MFDRDSARRIGEVVRRVEGMPMVTPQRRRNRDYRGGKGPIRCFQSFKKDEETLAIRCGKWRRYGPTTVIAKAPQDDTTGHTDDPNKFKSFNVIDILPTGSSGEWYACVYLKEDTGRKHWELWPGVELDYTFTQDFTNWYPDPNATPFATSSYPPFDPVGDDRWNVFRVLSKFTIEDDELSSVEVLHEGCLDDLSIITDTDSRDLWIDADGSRSTIDYNPDDSHHKGVLQLRNVEQVGDWRWAVPYFKAEELSDTNSYLHGELFWANIDAKYPEGATSAGEPVYKSIDVWGSWPGNQRLEVYDFHNQSNVVGAYHGVNIGTGAGTDPHEVFWQAPVALGEYWFDTGEDPRPLDPYGTSSPWSGGGSVSGAYFIGEVSGAATGVPSGGGDVEGHLTIRGYKAFVGAGALRVNDTLVDIFDEDWWADINWHNATPPHLWYKHTDLDFSEDTPGQAGQNRDHDWRYWIQGDNWTRSLYGESIGYGVGSPGTGAGPTGTGNGAEGIRIHLGECRLYENVDTGSSSEYSVDWYERTLWGRIGPGASHKALDWEGKTLHIADGNETITLDWAEQYLLDTSTSTSSYGTLSVDWDLRRLHQSWTVWTVDWSLMRCYDTNASPGYLSIDWSDRHLVYTDGTTVMVDWADGYMYDASSVLSINWTNRSMFDSSNNQVMDYDTPRRLYASDGSTISFEFDTKGTDPTDITETGAARDGEVRAKVNDILDILRLYEMI